MRRLALVSTLLWLPLSVGWGASIELFSTPDYTSCNLATPTGIGTFYVVAVNADEPICCGPGLMSVAFSLSELPDGWGAYFTLTPQAVVSIGNLFQGGVVIAFGSPQMGSYILLYTVTVLTNPALAPATLTVLASKYPLPWSSTYCPYRGGGQRLPVRPQRSLRRWRFLAHQRTRRLRHRRATDNVVEPEALVRLIARWRLHMRTPSVITAPVSW